MTHIDQDPDKLEEIIRNPDLLDRLGSSDLKRVGKFLARTLVTVGNRADATERSNLSLQIRLLEVTGGNPPDWSYLHADEAMNLHVFTGFSAVKSDTSWVVCGEENGVLRPIYEYDFEDYGTTEAESRARLMLVHLRQTFIPRTKETT